MKEGTHFTASAYVIYDDTVLLHRHKKIGLLLPMGGYLEEGELPEEAVRREIKEESGLDVEVLNIVNMNSTGSLNDENWHQANPGMTLAEIHPRPGVVMLDFTFVAVCVDVSLLGSGELEKDAFVFLSEGELENSDAVKKNVRFYGVKALEIVRTLQ